jgi:hypothetical protein
MGVPADQDVRVALVAGATIEETGDLIRAAGGDGLARVVDHENAGEREPGRPR